MRGDFAAAQRSAEAALAADPPRAERATALLVAADAAAAQRLHDVAARHYGEILARHERGVEAPAATMGLAWAEYRQGKRDQARRTWTRLADAFPSDPQAPVALALAAEVASDRGDLGVAETLFDRILKHHASTPQAQSARLGRVIVRLRRQLEDDAVRDLDAIVRAGGTSAIDARRRLVASLRAPRADVAFAALPMDTATNGHGAHGPALAASGDPLERFAVAFLDSGDRAGAPYVMHGLVVLGATGRGWTDPVVATLATRLLVDFPSYPPATALLARVGASAVAAGRWPMVRQAYASLVAQDPTSAIAQSVRVDLAEAMLRTGTPAQARRHLDDAVAQRRDTARALLLRAEASEALKDGRAALLDYDRLLAEHPGAVRTPESLLAHARLLDEAGERARARPVLQRIVAQSKGEVVAEAAYRLARILGDAGEHQAAAEWYLTAAYVVEGSRWTRPALLGAGAALAALDETTEALALYRKVVPALLNTPGGPQERELGGEAAYRAAQLLSGAGRHGDALDMFLTSAHLTAGSAAERRALVGAIRCLVATGDRPAAEVIYRRLLESGATEPEHLAGARQALRTGGETPAR